MMRKAAPLYLCMCWPACHTGCMPPARGWVLQEQLLALQGLGRMTGALCS